MKKFKLALIIFILSAALFAVLRFVNLNSIPVFVDEAIYVRWSQVMKAEATLRFLPLSDGKQPLAMWLTMPLLKYISDPLIAGRLVSVFAGIGSMVGLALLTYWLFESLLLASFSTLVYAILPFTMFFDRMALADGLLAMFSIWSMALSVLFAKTKRLDHAIFVGFAIGGGLLTKSPAVFFYLFLFLSLIFFTTRHSLKNNIKKMIWGLLAVLIISQAMYNILRLGPGFNMINSRNQDYIFSIAEVLTHPLNPFIGNFKTTINWLWLLFTPPILIAFVLGFFDKKKLRNILLLFLAGTVPLLAQAFVAKVYTSRYALYAVDLFIPICAVGLGWILKKKGILIRLLIPLIILVPTIISFVYLFAPQSAPMSTDMRSGYLQEWTAGYGQKEIARYLIDLENKGNKIVVFTEGYFGTLPDGLQIYTEGHKNITIVGSPPNVDRIPDAMLKTSKDNLIFLVVNKSRDHLSSSDLAKLTLVAQYPKAVRPDGSREYLQFWQFK